MKKIALLLELVDKPDLGSGAARCESSSLSEGTTVGEVYYPLK